MKNVGLGYFDAWQPIINGPGAPVGNKSWIDWKVTFKTTAGLNYTFSCLAICAIDVDGDNGKNSVSRVVIVKKIQDEPYLKVSPNPANDYINVYLSETNLADTKRVQLVNLNGKKIIDISCRLQSIDINTSNLISGYYILNILDKAKVFSSQFLVKH